MTSSKIYPRKVVTNVVLMLGLLFLLLQVAQAKVNIVDYLSCTEIKEVNKRRKTIPFVKSCGAPN